MSSLKHQPFDWPTIQRVLRWSGLCLGPAALSGFLTTLLVKFVDYEQGLHIAYPWLFLLLPMGAIAIYFFQRPFPQKALPVSLSGLHESPTGVPRHSLFFIYGSTLITHLFGASAGREGAGFQATADIGQRFASWQSADVIPPHIIRSACIAASFGVIFGTPVAAAVFALELTRFDRFPYNALVPCGIAGLIGVGMAMVTGIRESQFKHIFDHTLVLSFNDGFRLNVHLMVISFFLAIVLGLLSCMFTEGTRQVRYLTSRLIQPRWLAPLAAAAALALLGFFTPARDYMGLGILPARPNGPSIITAFNAAPLSSYAWLWKLALTLLTIAAGFRGGEIAPLLFISTTLAHTLLPLANIDLSLLCALAFIGILAASANTPFAAIILSVELFGGQYIVYFTFCCLVAYFISPATKEPGKPAIRGIPKLFTPMATTLFQQFGSEKKS